MRSITARATGTACGQTFRFKLLVCTALTVLGAGIFLLFGEDLILLYLKGDGSPEQIAASLGYAKEYLLIMLVGFIPFTLAQCYSRHAA